MATHYTTLGVAPDAPASEIRRAYHAEARRWHPDRFADGRSGGADAATAENRMREVNEAWHVLGDTRRRAAYDRELSSAGRRADSATTIRVENGVPRVDPRLLDPEFVAARRRHFHAESEESKHSGMVRVITVVGFFGLLLGIVVFTAYAAGSRSTSPSTTVPGPDIGVEAGACVRQMSDGQLLSVPCSGTSDGRVIGARELDGTCPAFTVRELLLPNELVVCLGS